MRIAIASDHAALALKTALVEHLRLRGEDVSDLGPYDDISVDYPDYGYKLAAAIAAGEAEYGVVLCGSGIGISIAVNRNPACRAALVSEPLSAALAREHNDANVIAMGARLTGIDMAKACLDTFLSTSFAGDRHNRRVGKLSNPPT
jgi:ribose 5-phosphate isomerase B